MAPVAIDEEPGYWPLIQAISHVSAAAYLSYTVGRSLYQSHQALGPAQDTRHRIAQRSKLTTAFGSLAALGLVFAITSAWNHASLSYKVWASERGIEVPTSLFGSHESSTNNATAASLQLRRWLRDTPVYMDALEIVAEKPRRQWWGQQSELAKAAFTTLLAIEGRRRRIPHLWAYALLSIYVNLSFAQNLFYIALLLNPSANLTRESSSPNILDQLFPQKSGNWCPRLPALLAPLFLKYAATVWLPYAAGTPRFATAATVNNILTLAPLVLPMIIPESWGTVHPDPHDAYRSITKLYNAMTMASALLHARSTVTSLYYNFPGSYKHRHSIKIPFDTEKRSKWERSATAIEKVLGSMADHPAVAAVGKDVLLCALSLGLWAAVRAVDVSKMIQSVSPIHTTPASPFGDAPMTTTQKFDHSVHEEPQKPTSAPSMSLRNRDLPARTIVPGIHTKEAADPLHHTPRRRGRPRKIKIEPEPGPGLEDQKGTTDDETYEPSPKVKAEIGLGDVVPDDEFDWESASLAWALTALGGLGVGSAAVFGAECISR